MVALGRVWTYSKRGWSGLIAGKTDDGRRSCSGSVYCAEDGGRKGSLICSVCWIHGEPLGFGSIPKEVASTKSVEYRAVSGRVVDYGRMLYLVKKKFWSQDLPVRISVYYNSTLNVPYVLPSPFICHKGPTVTRPPWSVIQIRPIYECRCDERVQTKTKEFTHLTCTGCWV